MIVRLRKNRLLSINLLLAGVLLCIFIWRDTALSNRPVIEHLPSVFDEQTTELIAFSDRAFSYRLLLLWLQQYDVQAGQYVSYRSLDYSRLTDWLRRIQSMDERSQYPLLLATRIYTHVADPQRKVTMLEFVYQQFLQNPKKNWRWLAEAVVITRHNLSDKARALKYATALSNSTEPAIPFWARDMRLTLLEDMAEYEQLQLLIGGLISSKSINDQNELKFLENMLQRVTKRQQ